MKKRHLRLVVSHCEKTSENSLITSNLRKLKDFWEDAFLSKNEKIYIIK
ncbi:TPA: hypothetical protein IAA87_09745, partial [Candidatus Avigastranaerophilus faecigallinarum]|nr:hypothetical protein [Candidatus Avigastranaerophilus faecigallinarum]